LLERAAERCERRLIDLDRALAVGDERVWEEYLVVAEALAVLASATSPERTGRLLTSREMAERLQITERTLRRRRKRGELVPPVELGKRGRRVAVRWRGSEAG
jgi:hypothetical protein